GKGRNRLSQRLRPCSLPATRHGVAAYDGRRQSGAFDGVHMALVHDRGLVMYLYSAELLRFGARHGMAEGEAVDAEHWFLCIEADARGGWWTPLHPTRGQDRLPIAEAAKSGHPRWTQGLSWYSPTELWRIPHKAIQRAAQVA